MNKIKEMLKGAGFALLTLVGFSCLGFAAARIVYF